jgi:phosphopantetheine adenylyltransferase
MKKTLIFGLLILGLIGCTKDDLFINQEINQIKPELQIKNSVGLKLETAFVTGEVAMNVKSEVGQSVTIKIFDISNRVVSKETVTVKSGDNILKVYTSTLPSSAYRIGLYDSKGNQLGITDFNKL